MLQQDTTIKVMLFSMLFSMQARLVSSAVSYRVLTLQSVGVLIAGGQQALHQVTSH